MSAPTKSLVEQLRETVELLEAIAQDRTVLEGVPDEDRARLLQAVAMVYHPDRVERRRMANAVARERRASRIEKDQQKRAETGIQTLRRKPVFHTPNVFPPEPASAFAEATADKPAGKPRPGVSFVREDERWPGDQWAVRVEQTGRAVDWSASYFDGNDTAPDLGVGVGPEILLSHHRVRVVGADMTVNLGRFGMRAEGAYVDTEDTGGAEPFTKNPFVFIVAGVDRTWGGLLNLNVQYLLRHVLDDPAGSGGSSDFVSVVASQQAILNSQTRPTQHGMSLRLAYKWLHETLEGELAAAGYARPSGVALRPKVVYAVTDDWKAVIGAEVFRGEAASLFGLLRPNSTGYAELRWSF